MAARSWNFIVSRAVDPESSTSTMVASSIARFLRPLLPIHELKTPATFANNHLVQSRFIATDITWILPPTSFVGIQSAFPINGTEIMTVASCPAKDQRSSYSTGNKVKTASLTIFFVRGYIILYSFKNSSFIPSARRFY